MYLLQIPQPSPTAASIGGKAFHLLKLSVSFPIPPFCIAVQEFEGDVDIAPGMEAQIVSAIGDCLMAVRSSASVEDGANGAYAGLFETKLGVTRSNLAASIQGVLVSASSERVESYRLHTKQTQEVRMSVIVQKMIAAYSAGVCFTRSMTQPDACLIEAVYGLGQALVDGSSDPDRYTWDPLTDEVAIKNVSDQPSQLILDSSAGTRVASVSSLDRRAAKLTKSEVRQVGVLAKAVEASFGYEGCDIEWAFDESGALWLLQARPLTR